jgi:hypothetical protein
LSGLVRPKSGYDRRGYELVGWIAEAEAVIARLLDGIIRASGEFLG